jgi:excisionase family DNA binding protein
MDTPLLTSKDLAARFGVSVETVRGWVRDGRIPCIRASRKIVRFRIDEVEDALRQNATFALVGGARDGD